MSPAPTLPAFARRWILAREGGYVNDPHDRGGETKFGISKRAYPELNIAALTEDEACAIYQRDYWRAIRGDELPGPLALAVFDGAVNHGVPAAVKTLQRALANLGLDDVHADGLVGPATLHAAKLCWAEHAEATLGELFALRAIYYADIVRTTPTQGKYHRGWMKRVMALAFECQRLILKS